jgi:3-hydroxy acid dehydrogenase / malonic semialdehyde reductase
MPDRTAVVTGATSGFGLEIARRFAASGMRVVLVARREDRLRAIAEDLEADRVHVIPCDVRRAAEYAAKLQDLPAAFASPDILINNAGIGIGRELAQDADLADWLSMVETNVVGLIAGTQALVGGMVTRNRGHIVNIGSIASTFPTPRNAIYAASKAFMKQFGLCLRADLLGSMVRVTTLEPGQGGGTDFTLTRERGDAARAESMYGSNRLVTPADVADAVEWVVSRPPHLNVNLIQFTSIDQAPGPMAFANA